MVLQKVSFNRASMHCSPFIHRSASRARTHVAYVRRKRVQLGTNYKIERCTHLLNRMQHAPKQHKVAECSMAWRNAQCTMHIGGARCGTTVAHLWDAKRPDVEWIRFIGKHIYCCHCMRKPICEHSNEMMERQLSRRRNGDSNENQLIRLIRFSSHPKKTKRAKCDSQTFD